VVAVKINPTNQQAERIRMARVALTKEGAFPYYYPITFSLTLVETTQLPYAAAVDNRLRLYYNPTLTEALDDPELLGLLWHEVQHPARDHLSERGLALIRFIKGAIADRLRGEEAVKRLQEVYRELLGQEEELFGGLEGKGRENPSTLEDLVLEMVARDLANISLDLEINDDAKAAGVKLPKLAVLPEDFGFPPGLTAEEYALRILDKLDQASKKGQGQGQCQDQCQGQGQNQGQGQGQNQDQGQAQGQDQGQEGRTKGDQFIDALADFLRKVPRDIMIEEVAQALEREHPELRETGVSEAVARVAIRQTAEEVLKQASKEPGSVPAGLLRSAEAILKPRVDWRSVLRAKVGKAVMDLTARERPTYHRPHRRQGALVNVLLPGAYGLKPEVAVVIDTSGSMGERELGQALGELKALLRHYRPTVYTVDAEVHAAQKVFSLDQIRLLGGGGTDMGRGIERAVEDGHDLVVVLTDGYTPWPDKPPRATVVVGLIHEKEGDPPEAPPWAKVVPIPVSPRG